MSATFWYFFNIINKENPMKIHSNGIEHDKILGGVSFKI